MAAYAFARLSFQLKRVWFAVMLVTIMLPHHATLIPQYILFHQLGWVNTYLPLIVPRFLAVDAFFVFLIVQFIRGLPRELDDAAAVDGCRTAPDLPADHPAAGRAGPGHDRDLHLHLDLGRLLLPARLHQRDREVHGPAGAAAFLDSTGKSSGARCSRWRSCR